MCSAVAAVDVVCEWMERSSCLVCCAANEGDERPMGEARIVHTDFSHGNTVYPLGFGTATSAHTGVSSAHPGISGEICIGDTGVLYGIPVCTLGFRTATPSMYSVATDCIVFCRAPSPSPSYVAFSGLPSSVSGRLQDGGVSALCTASTQTALA